MTNNQDELIARLTRFYKETGSEVSGAPPAWVVPVKRRTAGWLQPALATIVLVALAVGLAVTIRLVREEAHRKIPPVPIPSASPSPNPSATATPPSGWVTRKVPVGPVTAMALDGSAVFALYAPTPVNGGIDPSKMALARIDRATGAVATTGIFPYAKTVARVPAGLWVAAGPGIGDGTVAADTKWLSLVDPVTLSVKQRVHLPAQADSGSNAGPQVAGASNLLWLGYAHSLYRLDPISGRILLTASVPGTVTSISLDPSGHRLYVGVDVTPSQTSQDLVVEWDALTGARLASATTGGLGLGGPQVAAAADGVWISFATGMMGAVGHLSATGLALLSSPQYPNTNGIHVFVSGGTLWLVDGGLSQVACADPLTGVVAASSHEPSSGAVVADANGSYLGAFDGVGFLRPDSSCPH
ncbi:MAG TPA: hypothetical protein VHK65_03485 [Candidatus Dormibacteraeota bacterium]|nr:hypothetical protein [Candidatus Dormibacteraeota bacterium]